jgi:hypothetical protein
MIQVKNERVWNVLKPVLQLASRYLDNAHLWPWYVYSISSAVLDVRDELLIIRRWDALLSAGDSENKTLSDNPHNTKWKSLHFRLRRPEEIAAHAVDMRTLLRNMTSHWVFQIRPSGFGHTDGNPSEGAWTGVTSPVTTGAGGSITLCESLVRGLLEPGLTV